MKPSLIVLTLVVVLVATSRLATAPPASSGARAANLLTLPRATPAGQITLFGRVASLTRARGRFELRFDPALWLNGVTARHATKDVSNDYYIVDETHRLFTYVVPTNAHVTILVAAVNTKTVTVADLARRAKRGDTDHRGFWIRIGGRNRDAVLTLDEQYRP